MMAAHEDVEEGNSELSEFEDLSISKPHNNLDDAEQQANLAKSIADLVRRCNELLRELEIFLDEQLKKKLDIVPFKHFRSTVAKEIKFLEKLSKSPLSTSHIQKTTSCSNIPFLEAVWATAKLSSKVVELRRHYGLIDICASNGLEWIKVSTVNEHRLLMELAKQGWVNGSSDSDEDDEDDDYRRPGASGSESDDDDGLTLLKMAEKLAKMAREKRIRYRRPRVRFVLPKIREGKTSEIDGIISGLRATGASVQCANDIPEHVPAIEHALSTMVADPLRDLSSTLNIDCTILLALLSDISHGNVQEQTWFNRAVRRQIEIEQKERLMDETLWPAMRGRRLVCTYEAARRMREITELIGTETEKARMMIIMGDDTTRSPAQLVEEFKKYSEYEVPNDWILPIHVDHIDVASMLETLPKVANMVLPHLSTINQSVFFYGWVSRSTTITSNRTVSKQIESLIELNRTGEDEIGPEVWLCPTSRSLVSKEKDRK